MNPPVQEQRNHRLYLTSTHFNNKKKTKKKKRAALPRRQIFIGLKAHLRENENMNEV